MSPEEVEAMYQGGSFGWLNSIYRGPGGTEYRFYTGVTEAISLIGPFRNKLAVKLGGMQNAWWPDPSVPTNVKWVPLDDVVEHTFSPGKHYIAPMKVGVIWEDPSGRNNNLMFLPPGPYRWCLTDEWQLTWQEV